MSYNSVGLELNERAYQTYLEETSKEMESEISSLSRKVADLRLSEKIVYVLRTRGKLLRPTFVLLSGQSVGAEKEPLKKLALAIELLHEATLVHDDILDNDNFRRNAVAVHARWGVKDAILVGDALASLSLNLAADYGREISKVISQACLLLCDGECIDALTPGTEMNESNYLEKITKKSASLFKAATLCGAIAGGGSPLESDGLAGFGENFGLAFQIRDDLADVSSLREGEAPNLNDLQTLPLIYMNSMANASEKRAFQSFLAEKPEDRSKRKVTPEKLFEFLENTGSISYSERKINSYIDRAVECLGPLKQSIYKSYLIEMADSIRAT